jgi:hypothetical protein
MITPSSYFVLFHFRVSTLNVQWGKRQLKHVDSQEMFFVCIANIMSLLYYLSAKHAFQIPHVMSYKRLVPPRTLQASPRQPLKEHIIADLIGNGWLLIVVRQYLVHMAMRQPCVLMVTNALQILLVIILSLLEPTP